MNSLKLKLRSANRSSREAAMTELRKSFRSKTSTSVSKDSYTKVPDQEQRITPSYDNHTEHRIDQQKTKPYQTPNTPTVQRPHKDHLPSKR